MPEVVSEAAPANEVVPADATVRTEVAEVAIVTPAAAVVETVVAAPVVASKPVAAAAEPVDLSSAGLVMIETKAAASAPAVAEAPVQLGRKPRPAAVVADEPLQMVETSRPN
ncbi:MAG TPA: hypothetical protein VGE73_05845 [Pseudolabrys sp.]